MYGAWALVFGRISLPEPPSYKSLFQQAIEDIQATEDRRAFEMIFGSPWVEPPNRFEKIERGVLDNLAS